MNYQHIDVEQASRITSVTLNRPERMNAINQTMHDELESAFNAFAADDSQYICVVRGAGDRAFCAGSDLKSLVEDQQSHRYPKHGYAGLIERFDLDKPVIAAVHGICFGGGFEVALACDLIIASESAVFALPEPKVGAIALGGGIHRLARQIGMKQAMGYLLTASQMSAGEARALGLVNEVVPDSGLDDAVARWCQQILDVSPMSMRATKETLQRGLGEASLEAAIRNQANYPAFKTWLGAADTQEGIQAFVEKRKPTWTGK